MTRQIKRSRDAFCFQDLLHSPAQKYFPVELVTGDVDTTSADCLYENLPSTVHDLRNLPALLCSSARLLGAPVSYQRRKMLLGAIEQAASTAERLTNSLIDLTARDRRRGECIDLAPQFSGLIGLLGAYAGAVFAAFFNLWIRLAAVLFGRGRSACLPAKSQE
jgi:hypothetical protein